MFVVQVHKDRRAQQDHEENPAKRDLLVSQVQPDLLVSEARTVRQDPLDPADLLVREVNLELQAATDNRVSVENLDLQDNREALDPKVRKVPKDSADLRVNAVKADPEASLDLLDRPANQGMTVR